MASEFDFDELKKLAASPSEKLAQTINKIPSIAAMQAMEKAMRPSQESMRPFAEFAEKEQRMREQIAPLFYDSAKHLMEPMRSIQESMRPLTEFAERERRMREQITPLLSNSALSSLSQISAMAENPWLKNLGTSILRDWSSFSVAQSLSAQECIQRLVSADKFLSTLRHANALVAPNGAPMPMPARFQKWVSVSSEESPEEQKADIVGAQHSINTAIKCTDAQIGALEQAPDVNDDAYHANTLQVKRSIRAVQVKLNIPASVSDSEALLPYDIAVQIRISPQQLVNIIKSSTHKLLLQAGDIATNLYEHGKQRAYDIIISPDFEKLQSRFYRMLPFIANGVSDPQAFLAPFTNLCIEAGQTQFSPTIVGLWTIVEFILNINNIIDLFQKF